MVGRGARSPRRWSRAARGRARPVSGRGACRRSVDLMAQAAARANGWLAQSPSRASERRSVRQHSSSEWNRDASAAMTAAPRADPTIVGHQQRAGGGAHEHLDPAAAGQPLQLGQGRGVLVRWRPHRRRGRSARGRRPGRACRRSASAPVVVGSVFGISNTAVTPPSTAAREPLSRSSFHSRPGSRKCTWVSMTPGSTVRPGRVEHLAGRGLRQVADRGDAPAAHADVGEAAAGVVHHLAAAHDQVEGLRHRARRAGRRSPRAAPRPPTSRSRRRGRSCAAPGR